MADAADSANSSVITTERRVFANLLLADAVYVKAARRLPGNTEEPVHERLDRARARSGSDRRTVAAGAGVLPLALLGLVRSAFEDRQALRGTDPFTAVDEAVFASSAVGAPLSALALAFGSVRQSMTLKAVFAQDAALAPYRDALEEAARVTGIASHDELRRRAAASMPMTEAASVADPRYVVLAANAGLLKTGEFKAPSDGDGIPPGKGPGRLRSAVSAVTPHRRR